jgi:hypothetical protein
MSQGWHVLCHRGSSQCSMHVAPAPLLANPLSARNSVPIKRTAGMCQPPSPRPQYTTKGPTVHVPCTVSISLLRTWCMAAAARSRGPTQTTHRGLLTTRTCATCGWTDYLIWQSSQDTSPGNACVAPTAVTPPHPLVAGGSHTCACLPARCLQDSTVWGVEHMCMVPAIDVVPVCALCSALRHPQVKPTAQTGAH